MFARALSTVCIALSFATGLRADDIHAAVRRNDLAAVKVLLDAKPELVNDKADQTPLHEAAAYVSPEMVKLLLERGADVNAVAYNGFTPLHVVRNQESARLLLKAGADLGKSDSWGHTPLQAAISADELGIAETLMDAGAPVDLVSALMLKKTDLAKQILAKDPGAANPTGRGASLWGNQTPLGLAAGLGDLELVKLLIGAGAKVDGGTEMPNAGGTATPLCNAIWSGHTDIVRLLLESGATTRGVGGKFYNSIFDFAVQHSKAEIVKLLLDHGALESEGEYGFAMNHSPLGMAAGKGHLDKVQLLLKHEPAYFNEEDKRRALMVAALHRHAEVVAFLRANGAPGDVFISAVLGESDAVLKAIEADPLVIDSRDALLKRPLLSWAIAANQTELAKKLIEKEANVNDKTTRPVSYGVLYEGTPRPGFNGVGGYAEHTETPLLVAIGGAGPDEGGTANPEIVHLLLERGAEPNIAGWIGTTPLTIAIQRGNAALVEDLLAHGANPNVVDEHGSAPIHSATQSLEMTALLLKHGADPNTACGDGATVLDLVLYNEDPKVADALMAKGANLSLRSACALGKADFVAEAIRKDPSVIDALLPGQREHTPLTTAAMHGQVEVAKVLLDAGATLNFTDHRRHTPMHAAAQGGHVPVAKLFVERGAKLAPDSYQGTPLHIAAMFGKLEMVRFLLDQGADVNGDADHGGTPLQSAAYLSDSPEVVELLISRGADVNHRNGSGETALHSAALFGLPKVAKVLLEHGADPNIRGARGKTALGWARWNNGTDESERSVRKAEVARLLIERGGK